MSPPDDGSTETHRSEAFDPVIPNVSRLGKSEDFDRSEVGVMHGYENRGFHAATSRRVAGTNPRESRRL